MVSGIGRPDIKKLVPLVVAILAILSFSNLSLAEMTDGLRDELDKREILPSLADRDPDNSKYNSVSSGSTTTSNSGSGSGSISSKEVAGAYTKPASTDLYSQMERYAGYYNAGINDVPDVVKKVAGDDVILLDIDMNDNSNLMIKVVTKDGLITEFRKLSSAENIDPTVTVTGNENAIRGILKNDDPVGYLGMALDNGSIDIECKGFLKKAALAGLKAVA
ncbi:hypothetical protein [Methanolobus profundi]|uniref:Uncharacterized protein n=1 Tax=Methanolobus profundi TaxID=487685 RepID=A0A1I4PKE3_9EURY|nr:hypothetical protein [Methanolobus profundi]SFM27923.1 hypothetical protein SAMN04488696_0704 [Methanolobus profundi]